MKKMYKINERIYHDFGDEILSSTEYLLKKYDKDNPDLYISFTSLDKLGINPQSTYETPLGIYTYPLYEILEGVKKKTSTVPQMLKHRIGSFVPFAGDSPWVWIIEADRSKGEFIEDIGDNFMYTHSDYEKDLEKLKNLYLLFEFSVDYNSYESEKEKIFADKIWQHKVDSWGEESRFSSPGGYFWNVTRNMAKLMGKHNISVKWNKILRDDLGYIGVADKSGKGIIHPSEKVQAVFFSTKSFKIIEKVENTDRTISETEIIDQLEKYMSKLFLLIPKLSTDDMGADDNLHGILTHYVYVLDIPYIHQELGEHIVDTVLEHFNQIEALYNKSTKVTRMVIINILSQLRTKIINNASIGGYGDIILNELDMLADEMSSSMLKMRLSTTENRY